MDTRNISRDENELANWLRLGCEGNAYAYECFLHSISVIVRGMVHAKAGGLPAQEQEDIVQDVLLAVHQKRNTWRQDHPVKPWIYAIARYKIVDAFRARGRAVHVDIDEFTNILAVDEPEHLQDRDVEILLEKLPPKQQSVVRLIAQDGLSIDDTAKQLNMNPTAVRVNFHRGLERLKTLSEASDT